MPLAERLPKRNALCGGEYESEVVLCNGKEEIFHCVKNAAGKTLLVSDDENYGLFSEAVCSPRAISVVFEKDCLSLFCMPDGVSCVLAAGGKNVLHAARFFAEVTRVPCVCFPQNATLCGALEERGEVLIGGKKISAAFKKTKICCDTERLKGTLSRAYARLLLAKLQEIERRALLAFSLPAFSALEAAEPTCSAEELILQNARIGELKGEGGALAAVLEEDGERDPEWRAYLQLSALYAAFFEKGKPRRYFTPDYKARAKTAGVGEVWNIPDAEEYARRAILFERIRAPFAKETLALSARREEFESAMSSFSPIPKKGCGLERLKYLPEAFPAGFCTVIRDFGLMEWD